MGLRSTLSTLAGRPEESVTLRIPIEAGILNRGSVRDWIKYAKNYKDLKVNAFENKGLIDSVFSVEIEGTSKNVVSVLKILSSTILEN